MRQKDKKRILLTGGHAATTAIAVIEEIRSESDFKDAEIYFVGSRLAMEGLPVETMEARVFPKIGVKFYPIVAGRLQTKFTRHTIVSVLKIPIGFFQAVLVLLKIKPDVTVSFGGFASYPVVFWSFIFGIPVILQEQTIVAGRAALASSLFASKIALARSESLHFFPKRKSVVTGNPVMKEIVKIPVKMKLGSPAEILVMGGSRGSHFINVLVMKALGRLLAKYKVTHITGEKDLTEVQKFREILPESIKEKYKVIGSVSPFEMSNYYKSADIIVGRSGANTVSESLFVKRPVIFIPLPSAFMDEQMKNAEYARDFGIAVVMKEKDTTPEALEKEISEMINSWQEMFEKVRFKKSPDIDASKKIVKLLSEYL